MKNLLSVNAITSTGGEETFKENKVIVKIGNITYMEGEKNSSGLYEIRSSSEKNHALCAQREKLLDKWHRRLGHIGNSQLKKLLSMSQGIKLTKKDMVEEDALCSICARAKQTRKPFAKERTRATRALEIIHIDVCEPLDPDTWDGNQYFITFLDNYTHHTSVYLMKGKYEVFDIVKQHIEEVESKWNMKVSKLRCDNGTEYTNEKMKSYCRHKGIKLDYTVPYTPQQNGRAERLNRTLLDKARAMIFDSGLQKEMWGEAIRAAVYILNTTPTESLKVTPYQLWNGEKPDLSNCRVFGCEAFAKELGNLKKLDERSKQFTFVGYSPNGYRLWDASRRKIVMRRDVKFNEKRKKLPQKREHYIEDSAEEDKEETEETTNDEDEGRENEEERQEAVEIEDSSEESELFQETIEQLENTESEVESIDADRSVATRSTRPVRTRKKPLRCDGYVLLTYQEAIGGPDNLKWKDAIRKEKESLQKNSTWELVNKDEKMARKNSQREEFSFLASDVIIQHGRGDNPGALREKIFLIKVIMNILNTLTGRK
ncbi:hypothetical protein DMN91_010864 [Ooceraea biroi]|uniref:Integrase catalytic domain-containing protein n=1 Tax=Ooceraea biroi TaxID=2015173 RepID=A0A3L8D912_OOCBI|nr:hypothetical protein DMN91_010864 [Ooceraea biroi]